MGTRHGNKQKHESQNPIQQRLLDRFKSETERLVRNRSPERILEVGCGEGYMLAHLAEAGIGAELSGVDISATAVAEARERVGRAAKIEARDARELAGNGETFDLVLMLEVLEHIPDPEQMLPILETLTTGAVLLSVPWEPWFRGLNLARGRHMTALGNDPEHVNHWSARSFRRFIESRFEIIDTGTVFPWVMVLALPRS